MIGIIVEILDLFCAFAAFTGPETAAVGTAVVIAPDMEAFLGRSDISFPVKNYSAGRS